nr:hypothetical protein 19 [bacterium]
MGASYLKLVWENKEEVGDGNPYCQFECPECKKVLGYTTSLLTDVESGGTDRFCVYCMSRGDITRFGADVPAVRRISESRRRDFLKVHEDDTDTYFLATSCMMTKHGKLELKSGSRRKVCTKELSQGRVHLIWDEKYYPV